MKTKLGGAIEILGVIKTNAERPRSIDYRMSAEFYCGCVK